MPFTADELKNLIDTKLGGEVIHSLQLEKVQCTQEVCSSLVNSLAAILIAQQRAGRLEELSFSSFSQTVFPLEPQIWKQFVKQCRQVSKLHVTSMAVLTKEARKDIAKVVIDIVQQGAQITDLSLQWFGQDKEGAQEQIRPIIDCILNKGLNNFTNIDFSFNKTCLVQPEFCEMMKTLLSQQT